MSRDFGLLPSEYAPPTLDEPQAPDAPQAPPRSAFNKADLPRLVDFAATKYGVEPGVLAGMLMKESRLRDDVISGQRKSPAGAVGIAQFMPDTARRYGIDPTDPVDSVLGMAAYLHDNLKKFGGDYEKAVAAYNWGENRKDYDHPEWKTKLPAETADYVDFVTQFARGMGGMKPAAAVAGQPFDYTPLTGAGPSSAGPGRGHYNPAAVSGGESTIDAARGGRRGTLRAGAAPFAAGDAREVEPSSEPTFAERLARPNPDVAPLTPEQMIELSKAPETQQRERAATRYANDTASGTGRIAAGDTSLNARFFDLFNASRWQPKEMDHSLPGAALGLAGDALELGGDALRGAAKIHPTLAKAAIDSIRFGADVAGADAVADWASGSSHIAENSLKSLDNPNGDHNMTGAVSSIGISIFGGLMTGGAGGAIAAGVGQEAADTYSNYRNSGASVLDATEAGFAHALAEYIGERISIPSLGRVVTAMAKKTGMPPMHFLKEAMKQQGGEQITTAMEDLYDKLGPAGTQAGLTWEQYLVHVVDTAKQTALMSALTGGAGRAARPLAPARVPGAADYAGLMRDKGFSTAAAAATNFTPANSVSAAAGLVDIVVPGAQAVAQQMVPDERAKSAAAQTQEQRLQARLESQLKIKADTNPAPSFANEQGNRAAGIDMDGGGNPRHSIDALAPQPAALSTTHNDGLTAATPKPDSARLDERNVIATAPEETWVGRRGDGYTTRGDAEMAMPGRRAKFPGLDWKIEPLSAGRFQLAGYKQATNNATPIGERQQQAAAPSSPQAALMTQIAKKAKHLDESSVAAETPEPASAPAVVAPGKVQAGPEALTPAAAENHNAVAPIETWLGRKGTGFTTAADAEQAVAGRALRAPTLDFKVEADGNGRYAVNGYARSEAAPAASVRFGAETKTLGIPRAEMPQIKSEHHGALVNFLNARGVTHEAVEVDPQSLRPTQAEYSPAKVAEMAETGSGNRSVLVSADNHILDGHHQVLAAQQNGEPVRALRLNSPIRQLLMQAREFPSATNEVIRRIAATPSAQQAPAEEAAQAPIPAINGYASAQDGTDRAGAARVGAAVDGAANGRGAEGGGFAGTHASAKGAVHGRDEDGGRRSADDFHDTPALRSDAAGRGDEHLQRPGADAEKPAVGGVPMAAAPPAQRPSAAQVRADFRNIQDHRLKYRGEAVKLVEVPAEAVLGGADAKALSAAVGSTVVFFRDEHGGSFSGARIGNRLYVKADGVNAAHAIAVHEAWHALPDDIKDKAKSAIRSTLKNRAAFTKLYGYEDRDVKGDGGLVEEEMVARMAEDQAGTSEFLSELARKMGDSDFAKLAAHMIQRLGELIRGYRQHGLDRFTTDTKKVLDALTTAFAEAHARLREAGKPTEDGIAFSEREREFSDPEHSALHALSQTDALFALPKSQATTIDGIAADNDPAIKVRKADIGAETMYTLTMQNGAAARITARKPAVYGPHVYGAEQNKQGDYDWDTTRPGENPDDVHPDIEDVWLDVSQLKSGDEGRMAYNIAATFAHNTGRIFIGDPAGLSDAAMRRRPEQMLSSALKFGTTRHLAPHPRQVKGDAGIGVPALRWVYGDDIGNITRLIDVNLAALENADDAHPTFDASTGQFHDADGQTLSRADIKALGAAGLGSKGLAGGNTIARAAVLRALLRAAGGGVEGEDRAGRGVLARLVRQQAVAPHAVDGIFYSREAGDEFIAPESLPDSSRATARLASSGELIDALTAAFPALGKSFDKMLVRGERGQRGGLVALASADRRDMAQALASKTPRTVDQALALLGDAGLPTFKSQDGDTQGFFDPKSGLTFVVLPNVTAATAPGVVLHEVVHSQQRADIDAKAMALIDDRSSPLHPTATREFLGRVSQRMQDAGEAGNPQEATSYIVEQAVLEGHQGGFSAADGRFMAWVDASFGKRVGGVIRDFVAMVRNWALRHGVDIHPTVDDLVAFAKAGVHAAAAGDVATSGGEAQASSRSDQTLTPAFQHWFGASKIVDRSGRPMVMYRGDPRDTGPVMHPTHGRRDLGLIFFSPSPAFASSYAKGDAGPSMSAVYLKADNPFDTAIKAHRDAAFQRLGDTTLSDSSMEGGGWEVMEDPDVVRAVKAAGFDGMYVFEDSEDETEEFATRNLAVFSSEQVKSATGNSGAFDPANPDVRFSVSGGAAVGAKPPRESVSRKVQRYGQDAMNRFTVVKNWAESHGVKLSDEADVWSFEERMHGRMASRLQDFREKTVKPIVQKIQAAGFTMAEVGEYLHMQHAEERNAQVARLDPTFTDGSGIPTAAARKYLAAADPKLAGVANELRAITGSTLKVLLDAGIINTDMTRAFAGAYRHYVPLKGTGEKTTPGEPGARNKPGKGNSVAGDIERATGRAGGVDQFIVENILRGHESAIVQAEKNILGHSLIAFVTEIANPEVATIGDPEKRGADKLGVHYEVIDDSTGNPTVYRTFDNDADAYAWIGRQTERDTLRVRKTFADPQVDANAGRLDDNEVKVYIAGHAVKVTLNDAGLSRAYQRLGIDQLPIYLAIGRDINRFLSKAYTGWNPEFSVVNPVRDFTTGIINVTGQYGAAASAKAVAKYPKALAHLMRYAYTGKSTPSIDAYRAAGGSTGAAYLGDIERIGGDIQHAYNNYVGAVRLAADGKAGAAAGVAARKLVGALTGWIEALNQATENAFRLAVFEALKGEHGINAAASAAKNSTVNFNRKGEVGAAMGAMYLFFNPTVQGTASLVSALAHGDHKWQARALVAGLVGVTYALAALQYGGGDDDDAEFKKIPGYVKDRSLVIRLPAGRYITIPIPYGYAFAATAGNALHSATHGGDIDTISLSLASSILDNFSPVGNPLSGADHWRNADPKGLLELLPGAPFGDLTKDAVRVIGNRSGLGHEIVPESHFDEGKPDHLRLYRATKGSVYDKAARRLSDATGGTQTQAGGIDVSPDTLKFWTRAVTGGVGTFIADTAMLGEMGARKLAGEAGDLSPELKEIPVVRRFVRDADIRDSRGQYWDAANEAKSVRQDYNRAKKARDDIGMSKVEKSGDAQLEAARSFIHYNRQVKRLRDEIDEIAQDDSLSLGMKRIQVKELEAEEKALYDEAIKDYGLGVREDKKIRAAR